MTLADYLKPDIYNRGIEHGIQQGLEQGLEQGLAKGEEKSKTEIARNMLSMGMNLDVISSVTGLSSREIKKL